MREWAFGVGVAFVVVGCSKAAELPEVVAPAPEVVVPEVTALAADISGVAVPVDVVATPAETTAAVPAPADPGGIELYKAARALHNSNRPEALRLYEQAAAKGHAASWKQIGSLKINDDTKAAIEAYKKYLELLPEAPDASAIREIITKLGGTP